MRKERTMGRRPILNGGSKKGAELRNVLDSLIESINEHDTYGGGHSYRVAELASGLATVMGFARKDIALVEFAALVHDVGKIAIPDRVLNKPDRLSEEEFLLIKLHPIAGASILSRVEGMEAVVPIVLHHHERWDGTGYPSGKAGTDIPIESRMLFAADALDTMTSERPYGRLYTIDEALDVIRRYSSIRFDPIVVDFLFEAHTRGLLTRTAEPTS